MQVRHQSLGIVPQCPFSVPNPHLGKMRQDPTVADKAILCTSELLLLEPMAFQGSLTDYIHMNCQEIEEEN